MTQIGAKVTDLMTRGINRLQGVRDAIYLDTNAWSSLAKGRFTYEPLKNWSRGNGLHIWMSRFQLSELSADTRLARPMAELLRDLPVVLVDRGQNEFEGKPWHKVELENQTYLHLESDEVLDAFMEHLAGEQIREANQTVRGDGNHFRDWLEGALGRIPAEERRDWAQFPSRLEEWVKVKCEQNGVQVVEESLVNPECYVGLKLSYAVLFCRYFISRKKWKPSDYVDYLHSADMAYAKVVVTEKGMAECIRQAIKQPEISGPDAVFTLDWLKEPKDVGGS